MKIKLLDLGLIALLALGAGCAHYQRVTVPPAFDLTHFSAIGIMQFVSQKPRGALPAQATRQFLQNLTQAQPGVRLVELGSVEQALQSVGKTQLDAEAIRAIAARNGVQALFAGALELTDAKPSLSLASFNTIDLHVEVTATLEATLYEGQSGALIWTNTAADKDSVGGASLGDGAVGVGVGNTDSSYNRLIQQVAYDISDAFRPHWIKQRVD